ncbi:hypothetical protein B0H13DRAFT_2309596 [Mycena leptocephala]|nr:hypothetical protein B0H13DRAFT_2309596 [Mycena leptocephala]
MSHDAASSSSAPPAAIPVASASSLPIHHTTAMPASSLVQQKTQKIHLQEHRATNEHVNGLLVTGCKLHPTVQMQISEFRDARASTHGRTFPARDRHNISARLLPALLRHIKQLQGSGNRLTCVVDTLALAAVAPAPSAKRTRDEDVDDVARKTRLHTEIPQTVALPTTFVYTPPVLGPSPVAVSGYPVTTTPLPVAPPAAPSAPPRASAPILSAPSLEPATPPRAHAIPQRQAAPQVAATLQVVFGLITLNCDSQKRTQDMVILLAIVLQAAAHLEISSTRRYKKLDAYTAIAFASPEIANWVVDSWDHAAHY